MIIIVPYYWLMIIKNNGGRIVILWEKKIKIIYLIQSKMYINKLSKRKQRTKYKQ